MQVRKAVEMMTKLSQKATLASHQLSELKQDGNFNASNTQGPAVITNQGELDRRAADLQRDVARYKQFWAEFGLALKLGAIPFVVNPPSIWSECGVVLSNQSQSDEGVGTVAQASALVPMYICLLLVKLQLIHATVRDAFVNEVDSYALHTILANNE